MGAVRGYEVLSYFSIADKGYQTPCWLWKGPVSDKGYGIFSEHGKHIRAHRYYYTTHVGSIPADLELDHLCHVRHCVNPAHLEAVPHTTNIHRATHCKLTLESAEQIREFFKSGKTIKLLAHEFKCSATTIRSVLKNLAWAK